MTTEFMSEFEKTFTDLSIRPIYNEFIRHVVIFTFTEDQLKEAIQWSNTNLKTRISQNSLFNSNEGALGFVSKHSCFFSDIQNLSILNINFDRFKTIKFCFFHADINIRVMETINHELLHLVEQLNYKLIPKQVGYCAQEPKAYTMNWVTRKFYEEYKRQGYGFEFKNLTIKDKDANTE
jgi:hypothetical protein